VSGACREPFAQGVLRLGLAGDGSFRWVSADLSEIVEAARQRLDLSPVASAALGRAMAASALLLRLATKTPTRLVLDVVGDGPIQRVLAEADADGNLRGVVGDHHVRVPDYADSKLAVGTAVGSGRLRVLREHPGGSYHSQVDLVSGEIGDDVAHYLDQSEQIRSAVLLGVLGRHQGIAAAGGLIVEVLPGAEEVAIERLEENLRGAGGVSRLLEANGLDGVLTTALAGLGPEVREERPLAYRCRCDRERLLRLLVAMDEGDRESLREDDGRLDATCHYCGTVYSFGSGELDTLAG
jgi:molecular chaperone Hsp33